MWLQTQVTFSTSLTYKLMHNRRLCIITLCRRNGCQLQQLGQFPTHLHPSRLQFPRGVFPIGHKVVNPQGIMRTAHHLQVTTQSMQITGLEPRHTDLNTRMVPRTPQPGYATGQTAIRQGSTDAEVTFSDTLSCMVETPNRNWPKDCAHCVI